MHWVVVVLGGGGGEEGKEVKSVRLKISARPAARQSGVDTGTLFLDGFLARTYMQRLFITIETAAQGLLARVLPLESDDYVHLPATISPELVTCKPLNVSRVLGLLEYLPTLYWRNVQEDPPRSYWVSILTSNNL